MVTYLHTHLRIYNKLILQSVFIYVYASECVCMWTTHTWQARVTFPFLNDSNNDYIILYTVRMSVQGPAAKISKGTVAAHVTCV